MFKNNFLLKTGGIVFVFLFIISQTAYADTWYEDSATSSIYSAHTTYGVAIGTTNAMGYNVNAVGTADHDNYVFQGYTNLTGEKDIFIIYDNDAQGYGQDESSVFKILKYRSFSDEADGASLAELTYQGTPPTVADRQFYILGRGGVTANEGQVSWGISANDSDFWTVGSINGGATGTDCGGTGAACFSSPTFHLAASGDSYINGGNVGIGTNIPDQKLVVNDTIQAGTTGNNGNLFLGGQNVSLRSAYSLNVLGIYTNNTERVRINSSGYVGIGTSSPLARLNVKTGTDEELQVVPGVDYSGADGIGIISTNDANNAYKSLLLEGSSVIINNSGGTGNVGIGTSSPDAMLDVIGNTHIHGDQLYVAGTSASAPPLHVRSTGGASTVAVFGDTGGYVAIGTTSATKPLTIDAGTNDPIHMISDSNDEWYIGPNVGSGSGFGIHDVTAGMTRLKIDTSGNVGVGTTSPTQKLDVDGYVRGSTGLCIGSDCRTSWPSSSSGTVTGSGTTNYITKWSSGSAVGNSVIYDNGTNVGIGTTSLSYKLNVDGAIMVDHTLYGPSGDSLDLQSQSGEALVFDTNGNNERMRITSDGYVGIGDTTPEDGQLKVSADSGRMYAIKSENWDTTGNTAGVFALTNSDGVGSGSPVGIEGLSNYSGEGGDTIGVYGRTYTHGGHDSASSNTSAGVYGEAYTTSGMSMGVWGETFSSDNGVAGVMAVANTSSGAVYGLAGVTHSSSAGSYGVYSGGPMGASGTKSAIVYTDSQGPTELYVTESPEVWFEDIGRSQLQNGKVVVKLDPLFLETVTINDEYPMEVFVQPYGDVDLFVVPGITSFEVIERNNGQSNIQFSYRVMAKRKYYENKRLQAVPATIDKFMRPDLTGDQIQALNQEKGLPYINFEAKREEPRVHYLENGDTEVITLDDN